MKTKIFKEIETLDEALKDFPSIYNFYQKIKNPIDYINFPFRWQFGNRFIEISDWSIKSTCKGNFGGFGGRGKYFSWRGIKISLGQI